MLVMPLGPMEIMLEMFDNSLVILVAATPPFSSSSTGGSARRSSAPLPAVPGRRGGLLARRRRARHPARHAGDHHGPVRPARHARADGDATALRFLDADEEMPVWLQYTMKTISPTPHFVSFAQAVLFRGADLTLVWQPLWSPCW